MAMQRTLLEMVQSILASTDGDEVTAITDTAESKQIADIIRQSFYEIASNEKLPEHFTLFELTETSSSTPVTMTKPTGIINIDWIKYDNILADETSPNLIEVEYVPFDVFSGRMLGLDSTDSTVEDYDVTVGSETFKMKCWNDKSPVLYTTYNDNTILFDAYDAEVETYLKKSKTMCWGLKEQTWTHSDSFVPPLDHRLSNLLFQEAKAQVFSELKQIESVKTEKKARQARLTVQQDKADINGGNRGYYYNSRELPHYGRK